MSWRLKRCTVYSRATLCYPEKERQIWGPLSCQVLSFLGMAHGGNGLVRVGRWAVSMLLVSE